MSIRDSAAMTLMTNLVLALSFAIVFALSMKAVLIGDHLRTGQVIRAQDANTMAICVVTAFASALVTWQILKYAKSENLITRLVYALIMLVIVYCAIGGLLLLLSNLFIYSSENTANAPVFFDGFFWESLSGFYAFAIFMISALNAGLIGLFLASALYLAIVGPQNTQNRSKLVLRTSP